MSWTVFFDFVQRRLPANEYELSQIKITQEASMLTSTPSTNAGALTITILLAAITLAMVSVVVSHYAS